VDRDSLVVLLGQGLSVEEIGRRFDRHPSTVSYWLRKHGLEAVKKDKHAARPCAARPGSASCCAPTVTQKWRAERLRFP
jgi:transposase